MKEFELKKKDWLETSVFRISLVKEPAIEEDFIFLNKDDKQINFSLNEEKRMIYSPVLIPNKRIPRKTKQGEEYKIFLSGDTIEEIARDYMMKKTTLGEWNLEHDETAKLKGVDVVENWIVEDPANDKATKLGFKVPAQTWMQGTYISDDKVWNMIKNGDVKGVSVEMEMAHELTQLNKSEMSDITERLEKTLVKMNAFMGGKTKLASMEVGDGVIIYGESFEEGSKVFADEAMTVPFEGSFEKDGKTYSVVAGVVASTTDEEEMTEEFEKVNEVLAATVHTLEKLSKQNESYEKQIADLKVELSAIKEETEKNTTKLAKVETVEPKSVTKLSADTVELSGINKHFNKG